MLTPLEVVKSSVWTAFFDFEENCWGEVELNWLSRRGRGVGHSGCLGKLVALRALGGVNVAAAQSLPTDARCQTPDKSRVGGGAVTSPGQIRRSSDLR